MLSGYYLLEVRYRMMWRTALSLKAFNSFLRSNLKALLTDAGVTV